ncbi:MAG: CBS domain-containing protein [Chloroflexi bacterium]|nr:CBS domain-containing protein [Chloroflexota bacterium]
MVAASRFYPHAVMAFSGSAESNVREFLRLHKDLFDVRSASDIFGVPVKKLIIVDTSLPSRLGEFRNLVNNPQVEVHVYDHHPPTEESVLGDVNEVELYGAVITMFVKKIRRNHLNISPQEATLFLLAIYEETGNLTYSTTTPDDVEAAAWLLKRGGSLSLVLAYLQQSLREPQRRLLNELILNAENTTIHGYRITIAMGTTAEYTDELALITHRLRELEKTDAIFVLVSMKNRIYIVARSSTEDIPVDRILEPMGGGGHHTAAAGSIRGVDLEGLKTQLLDEIRKSIKPLLTAKDVMSSPVRCLSLMKNPSIKDAQKLMQKWGHSSLLITEGNQPIGIITRRDVDKAARHNLSTAPVSAYMSRDLIWSYPGASLKQLMRLMIEHDVGRIPIVEEGKVVGIVTRTDILRTLHGAELPITPSSRHRRTSDYLKNLPLSIQGILEQAGEEGDRLDFPVYVVGGFVRDLYMGVDNFDVDLVVEGDGIIFAHALAERLGGRTRVHEKFGTAIIILPDGYKIDIATSRSEYYARPAALPEITESSLKNDLYRRDFSINAMAIKLNRKDYGQLIDFFGARHDLKNGTIRVLHNLSFIEDPTRIYRAIRFEQRFQFKMDQNTENLLKSALALNIFRVMPDERIRDELIAILSEPRPLPALLRMQQLKILRLIHPRLVLTPKVVEIIEEITATLVQYHRLCEQENIERWIIYFTALVSELSPEEIEEIGRKFRVTADQIKKLIFRPEEAKNLIRTLSVQKLKNSLLYRTLHKFSTEMLLYFLARTKSRVIRQRIAMYLSRLHKEKPMVMGKQLKEWGVPPGPEYRSILDKLFDLQLDGGIQTVEDAKDIVLSGSKEKLYGKSYLKKTPGKEETGLKPENEAS